MELPVDSLPVDWFPRDRSEAGRAGPGGSLGPDTKPGCDPVRMRSVRHLAKPNIGKYRDLEQILLELQQRPAVCCLYKLNSLI